MGKKRTAVMCAAPGTQGHVPDSRPRCASGKYRSEIDLFCPGNGVSREAFDHFRSHFITVTANTYATMHYNIARLAICGGAEGSYAGLKNAAGDPAPTGMDQGCGPRWRMSAKGFVLISRPTAFTRTRQDIA